MTTILAAFDNERAANAAVDQLAEAGVPRDDVHVEGDLVRMKAMSRGEDFGRNSVLGSAGRMFADLIRTNVDHHHVNVMTEAIERGATILVVRTTEPAFADTITAVLRVAGAYDISVREAASQPG